MHEDFQMFQGNVFPESELSAKKINRQNCWVIGRESELLDLYNGSMNDLTPRGRYKRVEGGLGWGWGMVATPPWGFLDVFPWKIKHQQLTLLVAVRLTFARILRQF